MQVSEELGANRYEQAWKAVQHSLLLGFLIACGFAVTIALVRDWYASHFVSDPHLAKTLSNLLLLGVIEMFLLPITIIMIHTVHAAKIPKVIMTCDLIGLFFLVLFSILGRYGEGIIYLVYSGFLVTMGVKVAILTFWVLKLRTEWLRRRSPMLT